MNKELEKFARDSLLECLGFCTEEQRHVFKRMYSPNNLSFPLRKVIEAMPASQLDWAMTQVSNTLRENQPHRKTDA